MAAPRIFVSSTYYDLRYVRADLQRFERETGFELILFERGQIPYDGRQRLEDSCLDEIEKCDIVVSIIGGRSGTTSQVDPHQSISRREVEHAVELGRQLFVFVERSVHAEFETYLGNIERAKDIQWRFVESVHVFEFIEYIQGLPSNNAMFSFDTSQELMLRLRDQLTGLFQTILQQQRRGQVDASANRLVDAVQTLNSVVEYLKEEKAAEKLSMEDLVFSRHPAFADVRTALGLPVRVIFGDMAELDALFEYAGFVRVGEKEVSPRDRDEYFFWARAGKRIGVSRQIFCDGSGDGADPVTMPASTAHGATPKDLVIVRESRSHG